MQARRLEPTTYVGDVRQPIEIAEGPVAIDENYVGIRRSFAVDAF